MTHLDTEDPGTPSSKPSKELIMRSPYPAGLHLSNFHMHSYKKIQVSQPIKQSHLPARLGYTFQIFLIYSVNVPV